MMTKNDHPERSVEKTVRDIRRATRHNYSAEEKIRIQTECILAHAWSTDHVVQHAFHQ